MPANAQQPRWELVTHCLDVQSPWSHALLDGSKTIETRSYPMPAEFEGMTLGLLVTASEAAAGTAAAAGPSLLIGTATFGRSVRYETKAAWAADTAKHLVPEAEAGAFGWTDSAEKFGWPVLAVSTAHYPVCPPPMARVLRSIFSLEWPPTGRVFLRPGFHERLSSAIAALNHHAASLLVLADFDRTLSGYAAPPRPGAPPHPSPGAEVEVGEECHDVLFNHASLGPGFTSAVAPLVIAADSDKAAASPPDMAALLDIDGLEFEEWEDYATLVSNPMLHLLNNGRQTKCNVC